jgi:hypothetical protein
LSGVKTTVAGVEGDRFVAAACGIGFGGEGCRLAGVWELATEGIPGYCYGYVYCLKKGRIAALCIKYREVRWSWSSAGAGPTVVGARGMHHFRRRGRSLADQNHVRRDSGVERRTRRKETTGQWPPTFTS